MRRAALLVTCVALSASISGLHSVLVDAGNRPIIEQVHTLMVDGEPLPSPLQYRLLPLLLTEPLRQFLGLMVAVWLLRTCCLVGVGLLVARLLRRDFDDDRACLATAFFYLLLPFTFLGYSYHPEDWTYLLCHVAVLWLLHEGRDWQAAPVVFLAGLSRETALALGLWMAGLLIIHRPRQRQTIANAVAGLAAALLAWWLPRWWHGPRLRYTELWKLDENLANGTGLAWFLALILVWSILWVWNWKKIPPLWRWHLPLVAMLVGGMMCFGLIREWRLLLPAFPSLLAAVAATSRAESSTSSPT